MSAQLLFSQVTLIVMLNWLVRAELASTRRSQHRYPHLFSSRYDFLEGAFLAYALLHCLGGSLQSGVIYFHLLFTAITILSVGVYRALQALENAKSNVEEHLQLRGLISLLLGASIGFCVKGCLFTVLFFEYTDYRTNAAVAAIGCGYFAVINYRLGMKLIPNGPPKKLKHQFDH